MNQWVEKKDGKYYWYQQFPKNEMKLLKRYHIAMGRMTKLDYSRIIK
jgi:hypothetical protein